MQHSITHRRELGPVVVAERDQLAVENGVHWDRGQLGGPVRSCSSRAGSAPCSRVRCGRSRGSRRTSTRTSSCRRPEACSLRRVRAFTLNEQNAHVATIGRLRLSSHAAALRSVGRGCLTTNEQPGGGGPVVCGNLSRRRPVPVRPHVSPLQALRCSHLLASLNRGVCGPLCLLLEVPFRALGANTCSSPMPSE
jgi:hypothetical protein